MRTLASICLDCTLLAQRASDAPLPDGYAFQRAVADVLRRPGLRTVQQAGLTTLWGLRSASGAPHELDAAGSADARGYLIEAKAGRTVSKADLAVFELKVTDFYFARAHVVVAHAWWPILVCAAPVPDSLRRLAAHRAVILCDPDRLALPVLYHHAIHPASARSLPQPLVSELRALAPPALASLQHRYHYDASIGGMVLRPSPYTHEQLDDLLYLQDELTDEVLARYDRLAPGRLERRAARHAAQFAAAA